MSRNNLLKKLSFVCIYFSAHLITAQNKNMTLPEALKYAEENYSVIKAKKMYAQSAEQNVKAVKREYIPVLKLHGQVNYGTANSVAGTSFPYGIIVPTSGGIDPLNDYRAAYGAIAMSYFEWSPFSFGQHKTKVNESKIRLSYAGIDAEQELLYHKINVAQSYFTLLVLNKFKELQIKNIKRAEIIKNTVVAATKSGLRPGVDSSFANAELSKAKLAMLEVEKNEAEEKNKFADMLGASTQNFTLDTSMFFNKIPGIPVEPQIADLSHHPLIKLYDTKLQLSKAKEEIIFHNYFPKVSLLAVTNGRGSGISDKGDYDQSFSGGASLTRFNYAAAVVCTFNILDYSRMRAELDAEKLKSEALKTESEGETLKIKNEILLADEKMKIALEILTEAPVQLAAASDTYKQKFAMYNSGLSNIVDLTQGLYELNRAEADVALAYDGVWKALLYKAAANGDINLLLNNPK
jgi:outer membrane protein TolC